MKIFTVGSINMDLVVNAPFMPDNGMTISGSGFMTNPGGKGANQAVAVSKLGGNSYMVGCVGNAFGDELKNTLSGYGVKTDYVEKIDGVSSGIAVIVVVDGDNRIILDKAANGKVTKELIDKAFLNAEEGDYVICQLEIDQDMVMYALKKGKELGMHTILNPAPAAKLLDGMLSYVDYFTPNQSEAEFYTGIFPDDEKSIRECALKLNTFGVKTVIITLGKHGSCAVDNGNFIKVDSDSTVKRVDTTAAGDTFVGALATSLSKGYSLKDSMIFGGKASEITITRKGAQQSIPYLSEIK